MIYQWPYYDGKEMCSI